MTNWSDPEVIAAQNAAFVKLVHAFVGLYFWEFIISIDFDLSFISGKRKFRWPMAFYFLNRYFMLATFICLLYSLDVPPTLEISCRPLYIFMQLGGNMSAGFASINLALRTMAIWNQSKYIVIPLVVLILGHWSLILQGGNLNAVWVAGQGCVIESTGNKIFAAQFIYTMCFDLIVLVLAGWRLAGPNGSQSRIGNLLFRDGLAYFVLALIGNIVVSVFEILNLNPVMNVMFNVPSIMIATIAATRAVRNLQQHVSRGPEVFSGKQPSSSSGLHFNAHPAISLQHNRRADGVHVQMETFTAGDGIDGTHDSMRKKNLDV
ncbi:unnamed protein product [Somion occarium]|uniref:Uncharacterized protein n=1 Tax=Somion occarium TaxID=3059160 RepID=A0ABP1DQ36_9APHY